MHIVLEFHGREYHPRCMQLPFHVGEGMGLPFFVRSTNTELHHL